MIRSLRQLAESPEDFSFAESGAEVDALKESANQLLVHLRPFMDGGSLHNFARETDVRIEPGELTYLDLESSATQTERCGLTLQALELLTYERAMSIDGNVVFAVDDAHFLTEHVGGRQMLNRHFRNARRYDLSIQLITQTIGRVFQLEDLPAVITNSGVIMFHQLQTLSDEQAKELGMTDSEAEFVRNAESGKNTGNGYAEALIRVDGADWQPIRTQPTRSEIKIADFDPEHDDPEELPV